MALAHSAAQLAESSQRLLSATGTVRTDTSNDRVAPYARRPVRKVSFHLPPELDVALRVHCASSGSTEGSSSTPCA